MTDAAREDELTAEEREQLRALAPLLPLLTKLVRRAAAAPVDHEPAPKVRRTATDEDFAEIQRIRRRKGLSR